MTEQKYYMDRSGNYFADGNGNRYYTVATVIDENGSTIYFVDENGNYYIDTEGNYYIALAPFEETPTKIIYIKYSPYVGEGKHYAFIRNKYGAYKKVIPYIKTSIPIAVAGLAVVGQTYVSSSL